LPISVSELERTAAVRTSSIPSIDLEHLKGACERKRKKAVTEMAGKA